MKPVPYSFKMPEGLKPWQHQLESFEKFKDAEAYAMLWTMGVGKTLEAINILEYQMRRGRFTRVLILCPSSISDAWKLELRRTLGETAINLCAHGSSKERIAALEANDKAGFRWVIANYEGLDGIRGALESWLKGSYAVCADESTWIKNARAIRSRLAVYFGAMAKTRIIMTGTPMPQGPHDIYGQYLFLDPSVFGRSFVTFRNGWMRMGGYEGKQIIGLKHELKAAFNRKVYSLGDRWTKEECLDLPPKVYETRHYDLSKEQRRVYDQLSAEWVAEMKTCKTPIAVSNGMTRSLRLAQCCTGFIGNREAGETAEHEVPDGDAKLKLLEEVLDECEGKAIIWCAWQRNVRDVMTLAKRLGVKAVDYYGQTKDRVRSESQFRDDLDTRLFVGTAASGGAGLNLQGPDVKTVVYYSQRYSVFERLQSEDRAHRGAIRHTVTVIDLVARKTVEEAIARSLREGRNLQESLLRDPAAFTRGEG